MRGASGKWSVRSVGDRVAVAPRSRRRSDASSLPIPGTVEFSGRRAVLEQPAGVWLGIDRGELGGGLWWLSRSEARPVRVSHENVQGIVRIGGRVTALTGLAFMTWDEGALLQPERGDDGSWRLGHIVPLGAAPRAFHLEGTGDAARLWIVTAESVAVFDGRELERLHRARYHRLEPDSVALDGQGRIFIGMRHLVARLTPALPGIGKRGFHEDWLVPPECLDVDPVGCACRPGRATRDPAKENEWPTTKPSPSGSGAS